MESKDLLEEASVAMNEDKCEGGIDDQTREPSPPRVFKTRR
jgi:hypothetical protein